jgi:NAD(P)-dependent dehydrogenase (short-subunit alcohol dehydrogenase family)
MQIPSRSFIVSGGASGLGAACVRMLVAAGGNVVIADLAQEHGEALAAELGEACRFVRCDVTDEAGVRAAIQAATELAPLGGALACAGIAPAARIVGRDGPHDLALFEKVVRVNLVGTFNLLRLVAEAMTKNVPTTDGERGVIVLTSSIAAEEGQLGQAAYAASKGAVASLTLPAARELSKHGIRVGTVMPGIFDTPLMGAMSDEVRTSLAAQIPFPPRFGQPEEFASLVRHLIENVYLNGTIVRLDGAVRMGTK